MSVQPSAPVGHPTLLGWPSSLANRSLLAAALLACPLSLGGPPAKSAHADESLAQTALDSAKSEDSLSKQASWQVYDAPAMAQMLRAAMDEMGIVPADMDQVAEDFLIQLEQNDIDSLDAYVDVTRALVPVIGELVARSANNSPAAAAAVDPNEPTYAAIESLPKSMRMSVRVWLGRELVRARLYDEALPVIAEVDPVETIDPASALYYRAVCYHALLMKSEALADLRRLLENEDQTPLRFSRTAQLMVADLKPLKEDSLDEISRLMTDVTRRLELGRADQTVEDQEQKIIDKLTKLIEKAEEQQKQQQQQQQQAGGKASGGQGGQGSPMQDSQAAGGGGNGDVDRRNIEQKDGWGNLPPAERHQALQQIGRDLPTHYREAIEAYFRKLATDGS